MPRHYNFSDTKLPLQPPTYEKVTGLIERCDKNCDDCTAKKQCLALWNQYACNIGTAKDKYTVKIFEKRFRKIQKRVNSKATSS